MPSKIKERVEPFTGISLRFLALLELDKPVAVPKYPQLSIVSTVTLDNYEKHSNMSILEFEQIPDRFFIIYQKEV